MRIATPGLNACLLAWLLAGCGGRIEPTGVYEADPASLSHSLGDAGSGATEEPRAPAPWKLTLALQPDGSFALSMQLPGAPGPVEWSGTWQYAPPRLELTTTHEDGVALAVPRTHAAMLTADAIEFRPGPTTARFTLRRRTA